MLTKDEKEDAELVEMTVEAARELIDLDMPSDLTVAIDNAQGRVFSGDSKTAVVVIRIKS